MYKYVLFSMLAELMMFECSQRCLYKLCTYTRWCSVKESRWCNWKDYVTHTNPNQWMCFIFHAVSSLQVSVNFGPHFKYPPKDIKYQPVSMKPKVIDLLHLNTLLVTVILIDRFLLVIPQMTASYFYLCSEMFML